MDQNSSKQTKNDNDSDSEPGSDAAIIKTADDSFENKSIQTDNLRVIFNVASCAPRLSVLEEFDPLFINKSLDKPLNDSSKGSNGFVENLDETAFTDANESLQLSITNTPIINLNKDMDMDVTLETENSDLKLQLNASQQEKASLELEIIQKEEVIIKTQTEVLRKELAHKQEIKQLNMKLEEKYAKNDTDKIKESEELNKTLKVREAKLIYENNNLVKEFNAFKKILGEYQNFEDKLNNCSKLHEEYEIVKKHLSNMELSFSDLHQKYERSKIAREQLNSNEKALHQKIQELNEVVQTYEEKYETLKTHAKGQIEKLRNDITICNETYESEIHKLQTKIKQLEIQNSSLEQSLDQKIQECQALTALCDEVTGRVY